jgi:hypothetical protein
MLVNAETGPPAGPRLFQLPVVCAMALLASMAARATLLTMRRWTGRALRNG